MSNVSTDTQIVVSKELRTRIKLLATQRELTMREYLETIVPKVNSDATE